METVADLPHPVKVIEHVEIPMRDGIRLAARLWIPESADENPVPAIFEYIPYRKRDLTRGRDDVTHGYLAGHGYACIRVDIRGSGESEGVLTDQYRQYEMDDGVEVIEWLASQPWCDGNVAMMGISWGGFNGLQIASLQPPALKAVISACSTDDLYFDNMHYMGGCLLTDNLSEATTMFSVNTCPPDPALVGDRWRGMWMQRLEGSGLWLKTWLEHQRRDNYWRHGSISEDYAAIRCPVMAVGGWADGYTNAIFRLMEHLEAPRLALVGPWGHKYPHMGIPGPEIGFLQECLRFLNYWLRGEENGVMDEPMIRAWLQESVPPTTYYAERPGRWVGEPSWPSSNIESTPYFLADGQIVEPHERSLDSDEHYTQQSPLSVGLFAGKWASYTAAPDLPHDQREEDGGALVFESRPLRDGFEILGAPSLDVEISANRPVGMIAVRLSDVAPDDKATRVTYGLLNLTHRNGSADPEPMRPGERYRVQVKMNYISHAFPPGHRLRVSISTSYWAIAWPPPEPVRLSVYPANSGLNMPQRRPRASDAEISFEPAQGAPACQTAQREPQNHNWLVHRDLARDLSELEIIKDEGIFYIPEIDLEIGDRTWEWYTYQDDDFQSPRGETQSERIFRRGSWSIRTVTRTVLTCSRTKFFVHAELDAYESDERVYSQNWNFSVRRDLV